MQRYEAKSVTVTAACGHAVSFRLFGWQTELQHEEKIAGYKQRLCNACEQTKRESAEGKHEENRIE